ncbi:hypothetical protein [Paenibacillus sp. ISL-20]|uniref:hypothetical protein n=1 Tax=Paenibacillus sp. ISL-20 TaxID=2819163 RepID=UPI001BE5BBDC|nr:hypothetical protein [Paenibacillus sp. ISL-20]MBT2759962.1 hypothetical protein [Paenibacillus sp. ISL-20]
MKKTFNIYTTRKILDFLETEGATTIYTNEFIFEHIFDVMHLFQIDRGKFQGKKYVQIKSGIPETYWK